MRWVGPGALWLALIAQLGWMIGRSLWGDGPGDKLVYDGVITAIFAGLALTRGRVRWLATTARLLVGLTFLGSVADRFGLLGSAGSPGVSWGDFDHFVTYTRSVTSFVPAEWAMTLAVLATFCETVLGVLLVAGIQPRIAATSAALLLLVFGGAMTLSLGIGAQFAYAVSLLAAGAWTLTTTDTRTLRLSRLRLPHLRRREAPVRP